MGDEGKETYALKWIFFFFSKGAKTGESYLRGAQCGFWAASQSPAAHFPCCLALWEEGKIREHQKSHREGELQAAACEPA